jgi:hypothetical protein
MMTGRGAIGTLLALAVVALLGGCDRQRANFLGEVADLTIGELTRGAPGEAPAAPTREQLAGIRRPLIALGRADAPGKGFAIATVENDGYVTFQDNSGRSVVLHGALISVTRGFRYNLIAVKTQRDDPVVEPTPVADWPETLVRNYQFSLQHADDFQITVQCVLRPVARERIDIFQQDFDVMRIHEECANATRTFTNTYWVEAGSGFIWKSEQWIGPRVTPFTLEIIRPVDAG